MMRKISRRENSSGKYVSLFYLLWYFSRPNTQYNIGYGYRSHIYTIQRRPDLRAAQQQVRNTLEER